VPPLVIFRAEKLSRQWIPTNIVGSWRIDCNSKGWTSNDHGLQWLTRCFEPETRDKAVGEYRLLICDGHDSHITGKWIRHCMENNIILMILPPHSSHLTQPLDVGVFGPLKKHLATEIEPLIRLGVTRIQKVEWLAAFVAAHEKALNTQNILGGFRGTGIHPFEPTKVLDRVTPPKPPAPIRPSTPPPPTTPFNDMVLTSSPVDFNAIQEANTALNNLLESGNPITTPARKYVNCLTRTVVRQHTAKSITQCENEDMKKLAYERKRRLSGKRRVIDGKHIMTAEELLGVEEAEKATKARKAKQGSKASRKRSSKARKELTDESEVELELSGDGAMELLECIEVEM
jgi:DDE superfamily endonuclease